MRPANGRWRPPPRSLILTLLTLISLTLLPQVQSQLVNGQFFTAGLVISDAPSPARWVISPAFIVSPLLIHVLALSLLVEICLSRSM